ncbi:MAG: polysaccharide biosynthesis protein [Bacilli bacterium]|nr:polysaccharide biosynthesis protein [Bacilli bacterium]
MKKKKVMFISSTGGHLDELMELKPMFDKYDYHIVTEKTKSNVKLKSKYQKRISYLVYGTKDYMLTYPFKLLYNCFKSLFIYIKVRPKYIVTTGAHTAGPMCCLGKIFGSKIIYIETFANSKTKSATGSIIYKFADLFIVQWETMLELYPKATFGGWIF